MNASTPKFSTSDYACPVTGEALTEGEDCLESGDRSYPYNKEHGYYDFVPQKHDWQNHESWKAWQQLQDNGVVSYENDPTRNLIIGPRPDALSFMEFCNFQGLVLDIGCGPQVSPTHIQYCPDENNAVFVGIDPLVGAQPRDFHFVLGLGEYLPFRNELFDHAVFATSLDHFMDASIALKAAARVIKRDGYMSVWLGEKDASAPKPTDVQDWYEDLVAPEGADDVFHYHRYCAEEFEELIPTCGLTLVDKSVQIVSPHRRNLFYRMQIC